MKLGLTETLLCFSVFSLAGWALEALYRGTRDRKFVNPGLLFGPYLPLYGSGAVCLCIVNCLAKDYGLPVKILAYAAITTGLELAAGLMAMRFLSLRLWDYSDQKFNYKGIICLKFSVYWVALAFAFEYFILPPYLTFAASLSPSASRIISFGVPSIMAVDLAAVLIKRTLKKSLQDKKQAEAMFNESARQILALPEVKRLAQFNHHNGKTRLEHVKEVAYISFLVGQRLSLDCDAIVKGALLHDLFHYDWLREGPRLHGLRHHRIALENARKATTLSKKEEDIIKKHMWPLTVVPPRYIESLVVAMVDTLCSTRDYISRPKKEKVINIPEKESRP